MLVMKRTIWAIAVLCLIGFAWSAWDQAQLERDLCHGFSPLDYYPEGDPPDVPFRNRNAISEFQYFLDNSGWTTNQLIEGLMAAATNNMTPANWSNADCRNIAGTAMWKLSEINHPSVTNFFRWYNDVDETRRYKLTAVTAMFRYTNLEPSVMGYLRTLCVRTNIYDRAAGEILYPLFETLDTMPDDFKPAATNRVAQYLYFASHHVTDSQGEHDFELCRFLPAYSNSIQRLELMRYVAVSATNVWERAHASNVVYELSSIPTNQLNDVSWITQE